MRPVECARCGVQVLVEKRSLPQTSVQWTVSGVRTCAEFAGGNSARIRTCLALRDSIERAVKLGRLECNDG